LGKRRVRVIEDGELNGDDVVDVIGAPAKSASGGDVEVVDRNRAGPFARDGRVGR
jgi:hypothetical protein